MIGVYDGVFKVTTDKHCECSIDTTHSRTSSIMHRDEGVCTFYGIQNFYWSVKDLDELLDAIIQARVVLIERTKQMVTDPMVHR